MTVPRSCSGDSLSILYIVSNKQSQKSAALPHSMESEAEFSRMARWVARTSSWGSHALRLELPLPAAWNAAWLWGSSLDSWLLCRWPSVNICISEAPVSKRKHHRNFLFFSFPLSCCFSVCASFTPTNVIPGGPNCSFLLRGQCPEAISPASAWTPG